MRLLVTGGAGFIGSHFVRSVLSGALNEFEVEQLVVLDKLTYAGNLANLAPVDDDPRYRFVHADIINGEIVQPLVADSDLVINFAAETHVDRSISDASDFVRTNVLGTQVLLDAALKTGVDKFIQISTDEVYGSISAGSWTEESPLLPNSPYAASKASADLLARSYFQTYGLPVVITRSSNNYGPYQFTEKLIPLFVSRLLNGEKVPLYGDGMNVRDWIHVDDNCRAINLVAASGKAGEIYNIGGNHEVSNKKITEQLLALTGKDWDSVELVADRLGHDLRYSMDDSKIKNELGFMPTWEYAKGLAETVDWYRENQARWDK